MDALTAESATAAAAARTNAVAARHAGKRWGAPVGVTVEHVTKSFGETPALHGVSLSIRPGELIALLGPSGSGKTTLLRILAGLDFPTSGRVLFGAEDALGLRVQERHVGFVFQSYALFRHMTVMENIAFGLRVRPVRLRPSRRDITERVRDLLTLVQLDGLEKRYPSQLSGGQRQRVALARALAVEPRVLLLDEPFGALDAQVRKDLRRWLRDIHDRTGHTTVFVTHDQEEALELSDRVVVMSNGRIEQVGTPDEVYDNPQTAFVAGFIGESNVVPVRVNRGRVEIERASIDLASQGCPDGPAKLVFRPHDAVITEQEAGALVGTVIAERRHGARRRIEIEMPATRHRFEIDVDAAGGRLGGSRVAVRPTRWNLFPAS